VICLTVAEKQLGGTTHNIKDMRDKDTVFSTFFVIPPVD
jgi:hypothetical protein